MRKRGQETYRHQFTPWLRNCLTDVHIMDADSMYGVYLFQTEVGDDERAQWTLALLLSTLTTNAKLQEITGTDPIDI